MPCPSQVQGKFSSEIKCLRISVPTPNPLSTWTDDAEKRENYTHSLQNGFGAMSFRGVRYTHFTRTLPETMSVGRYVWEGLVGNRWFVNGVQINCFQNKSLTFDGFLQPKKTYPSCVPFSWPPKRKFWWMFPQVVLVLHPRPSQTGDMQAVGILNGRPATACFFSVLPGGENTRKLCIYVYLYAYM